MMYLEMVPLLNLSYGTTLTAEELNQACLNVNACHITDVMKGLHQELYAVMYLDGNIFMSV